MSGEIVLDASVAAKLYFEEDGSAEARRFVGAADALIAPDLLLIEMAHLSLKRFRRAECTRSEAQAAVEGVKRLIDDIVPLADVSSRAFDLAADHGFSAYDAAYVALAEQRSASVITADRRLAKQASVSPLSNLIQLLLPIK